MKTVKVLNLETREVITIPIAQLAAGMVRIDLEGAEYYVDGEKLKALSQIRQPQEVFDEDDLRLVRGIEATFRDVMPRPQFTLRALLVLMLAAGCFFGGIHFERERRRREEEAAKLAAKKSIQLRIQVSPTRGKIEDTYDKFDDPPNEGSLRE